MPESLTLGSVLYHAAQPLSFASSAVRAPFHERGRGRVSGRSRELRASQDVGARDAADRSCRLVVVVCRFLAGSRLNEPLVSKRYWLEMVAVVPSNLVKLTVTARCTSLPYH